MRDCLDLGGATDGLVGSEAALAVNQVRGEDSVDERRFAESSLACTQICLDGYHVQRTSEKLTNTDDVELETPLH